MKSDSPRGSIFRDAIPLGSVELLLRLKGFIIMPMLTHYLGATNYGAWSQVVMIVSMFTPLVMLGTSSSFIRYCSGIKKNRLASYMSSWALYVLGSSLIALLVLWLGENKFLQLFFDKSGDYQALYILAILNLVLSCFNLVGRQWLLVHFRTTQYSLLALFEAFISVIVLIAAISAEASVYIFILWSVIGVAFLDLTLGLYIFGKGGFGKPDFTILKPMLIYGLPLVPAGFSVWALNWIDRFVILQYLDMRSLGIYAFAYSIGYMVIPMLARPFWATYTPRVTASYNKADYVGYQRLFDNSAGAVVFLLVPAVVGMAVLSRFLVSALSPPDFSAASSLIVWVSSGYFFNIMSSYYSVQLGLIHKQYWPTIAITIAALCNYVLNTIMIPAYGLIGAAVATTLSFMIQFLIVFVRAKQNTKITENWAYLIKVIICSLLMGCVVNYLVELMHSQTDDKWIILILGTAFGFVSYALFVTIIGISPMQSSSVFCKPSGQINHDNDM